MAVKGRSARGEIVDFDLLEIKKQIASASPSSEVTRRKDFIENKMRRRVKKTPTSVPIVDVDQKAPDAAEPVKEDIIIKKAEAEVKPETTTETKSSIKKTTTKQKARTTKKELNENDKSTQE